MQECYHQTCDKYEPSMETDEKYDFMTDIVQSLVLTVAELSKESIEKDSCIEKTAQYLIEQAMIKKSEITTESPRVASSTLEPERVTRPTSTEKPIIHSKKPNLKPHDKPLHNEPLDLLSNEVSDTVSDYEKEHDFEKFMGQITSEMLKLKVRNREPKSVSKRTISSLFSTFGSNSITNLRNENRNLLILHA